MARLLALVSLVLLAFPAAAGTIPGALSFVDGLAGGYFGPYMPGPFQGTSIQGSSTTSFTYSDGAGSASLTGTANRGNNGAGGDAYLQFYFEVVGPSTIVVPLVFDAAGNVSVSLTGESSSQSYATAYAAVAGVSGFDISPFEIAQYYTPGSQSFDTSESGFTITSNTVGYVQLFVNGAAQVGNVAGGSSQISAFVDPQIATDPNFSLPAGYSLIFSPNPPTPAPEPATLALLGLGLAGLGFSRRKH